ncbi:hypothetical protein SAMN04244553_3609 [Nocardia amikacinitolerans]|uniref:Uncharacterized protein n=1 Tax=Nocardia amikacinitolerans TaxID=756689 RepID=A0A285LJJ4_9NOCA|nr:hypothetical protein [Nocardia amikacinitolerans]SNY84217.1 hypothetical protein SAMN04244553_3609 [Nocardia amikacinitolerans]
MNNTPPSLTGVWIVADGDHGGSTVIPCAREIDAYRIVHANGYGKVHWVPFNVDLHDIIYRRIDVPLPPRELEHAEHVANCDICQRAA